MLTMMEHEVRCGWHDDGCGDGPIHTYEAGFLLPAKWQGVGSECPQFGSLPDYGLQKSGNPGFLLPKKTDCSLD